MINIELDAIDIASLKDVIYNIFDVEITNKQLFKIIQLFPEWDGCCDTLGREEFIDYVCNYFIGCRCPMYGDTREYKDIFWKAVENNKYKLIEYVNEI